MNRTEFIQKAETARKAAYDAFEKGADSNEFVKAKSAWELAQLEVTQFDLSKKDELTAATTEVAELKAELLATQEDLNAKQVALDKANTALEAAKEVKPVTAEITAEIEGLKTENAALKATADNLTAFVTARSLDTELTAFKGNPAAGTEPADDMPQLSKAEIKRANQAKAKADIRKMFAGK